MTRPVYPQLLDQYPLGETPCLTVDRRAAHVNRPRRTRTGADLPLRMLDMTTTGGHHERVVETTALASASSRCAGAWVLRSLAATVLFIVAIWWSASPMWSGRSSCEAMEGVCDQSQLESYAPTSLWMVAAVGTLVACVVAAVTGPREFRQRLVWAVAVGASVFVAHRNNALWAVAVTVVSVYGIASTTDDFPPHSRQQPK